MQTKRSGSDKSKSEASAEPAGARIAIRPEPSTESLRSGTLARPERTSRSRRTLEPVRNPPARAMPPPARNSPAASSQQTPRSESQVHQRGEHLRPRKNIGG